MEIFKDSLKKSFLSKVIRILVYQVLKSEIIKCSNGQNFSALLFAYY